MDVAVHTFYPQATSAQDVAVQGCNENCRCLSSTALKFKVGDFKTLSRTNLESSGKKKASRV